jgi:hypothetical protein
MSLAAVALNLLAAGITGGTGVYLLYTLARDGVGAVGTGFRAVLVGAAALGLVFYAVSVIPDVLRGEVADGVVFMPVMAVVFLWYAARSRPAPEPVAESESNSEP